LKQICDGCLALQNDLSYCRVRCSLNYPIEQIEYKNQYGIKCYKTKPLKNCPKPKTNKQFRNASIYNYGLKRGIRMYKIGDKLRIKWKDEHEPEEVVVVVDPEVVMRSDREIPSSQIACIKIERDIKNVTDCFRKCPECIIRYICCSIIVGKEKGE